MELALEHRGAVSVIRVDGRLDAVSAVELKTKFGKWLNDGNKYVMDLTGMDFIDSTGLGSLVACLKSAAEQAGEIRLCGLRPKPRMVFEITRAYKIFDIYDDLEAAVTSFTPKE